MFKMIQQFIFCKLLFAHLCLDQTHSIDIQGA
jgi:hypothetical protein